MLLARAEGEPGVLLLPGSSEESVPQAGRLTLHQGHLRRGFPVEPMLKPIARRLPTPVRSRRPVPPHLPQPRNERVKTDPELRAVPLHLLHLVSGCMNSDPTQMAPSAKMKTASPLICQSSLSLPGRAKQGWRCGGGRSKPASWRGGLAAPGSSLGDAAYVPGKAKLASGATAMPDGGRNDH